MTKIKIFLMSLALLCVSTSNVWAQENTEPKPFVISPSDTSKDFAPSPPNFKPGEATGDNPAVIATAEINNAKIVSQDGNKLKISFDLNNREKIQPGIRYGLKLVYPENGFLAATEKVYDEVLNLGSDETIKKEIDFTAPKSLDGEYNLLLFAQNDKGLAVAMKYVAKVTFQGGTDNSVEIVANSCYLNVEGTDKKYTLDQGVDIAANENIILNCEAKNNFNQEMRVTPNFKIYYRTIYGKLIRVEDNGQLILPAKEKKPFSINVPKEQKPQAYDLLLTLFDSSKKEISNSIRIHYVIQGFSATVVGTRIDKDYYSKGDSAQVAIFWAGSADTFYGSRNEKVENNEINLETSIVGSSGFACSEPYSEKLETTKSGGQKFLSIPITKDCPDPKIQIALKDKSGNVLDQAEYAIKSKQILQSSQSPQSISVWTLKNIIFGLAILLIIIVAIGAFIKKRGQRISNLSIFIILLLGSFAFSIGKVEAASVSWTSVPGIYCSSTGQASPAVYNALLDSTYYTPGQTMVISASASNWATCANSDYISAVQYYSYYWNGAAWQLIGNETVYAASNLGGNPWATLYRSAPSTPGYYVINFYGLVYGADSCNNNCHCQGWAPQLGSIVFYVMNPPAVSISARTNPVPYGGTTILDVNSTNSPTWCTISGGQYSNTPCGGSGQIYPVALTAATTYTFTCGNQVGQSSTSVTVGVDPAPVNGTCGGAAAAYAYNATGWAGSYCNSGNPNSTPAFPAQGASASWTCLGLYGGASASCVASRSSCVPTYTCSHGADNCTNLPCGSTSAQTAYCTSSCGGSVPLANCGASCEDIPVSCTTCKNPGWKEVTP